RQNRLVQGQVWPSRNQTQQKICMLLQRRDAPAPRLSRTAARLPKALDPDNRRAGTDIKLLGRRAPRPPAFNFRNHSRPHVFRIGLRHRPASQNRINADRLSHPSPSENLLDSIGTEHALEQIEHAKEIMRQAGRDVCNGFEIDVDVDQKLMGGVRYADKRPTAKKMWATIMGALEAVKALPRRA